MADTDSEIHIPTLERCIAELWGSGEYKHEWVRCLHERKANPLETWTYTTHPINLLEALRPKPEKTEAERIYEEWLDVMDDGSTEEAIQFTLDWVKRQQPTPTPHPAVTTESVARSMSKLDLERVAVQYTKPAEPQYVYGPWIEWHGGERPVPGDWVVDLRLDNHDSGGSVTAADFMQWDHAGRDDITHYRVRFEVGQWYDWHGGKCPLEADTVVEMKLRDGRDFGPDEANAVTWRHGFMDGCGDIIRFKVIGTGEN